MAENGEQNCFHNVKAYSTPRGAVFSEEVPTIRGSILENQGQLVNGCFFGKKKAVPFPGQTVLANKEWIRCYKGGTQPTLSLKIPIHPASFMPGQFLVI